ncbi:MAG: uroporphyrinogen-III C-methyltransferase [Proteobacteria bacterium]|nr:uroporphyrinogen-III C-methyltransferase [Pseudomonadota bacterium]
MADSTKKSGTVYLIGSGPGDTGLMTLRGAEYIKDADVIIYDYLCNSDFLKMSSSECTKIYVGKQSGSHTLSQEEINRLLIEQASMGKKVARLKGGDPFVFGRGGEEAIALFDAGITFEIIPGVTAGIAASAYAGIPFTHRGIAATAGFVTGHESSGNGDSKIDWNKISGLETIVFYMGVKNLPVIIEKLKSAGRNADTPVALVRWGTKNNQKTVVGTIGTILEKVEKSGLKPPALIIVGEVVSLRDKLKWFENKALFGKKIVVTRSRTQSSSLCKKITRLGAQVIELPTIEIHPLDDQSEIDSILNGIKKYSWIVFTSVNSIEIVMGRLITDKRDVRSLFESKIAVIGNESEKSLLKYGLKADLIPEFQTSEGIVDAFRDRKIDISGKKILIPGSEISRDIIPGGLSDLGGEVNSVAIYENRIPVYDKEILDDIFETAPDLVTFTSSSTVSNLVKVLKTNNREQYISRIKGGSIGPVTSKTAIREGIDLALEADEHTIDGLIKEILNYL